MQKMDRFDLSRYFISSSGPSCLHRRSGWKPLTAGLRTAATVLNFKSLCRCLETHAVPVYVRPALKFYRTFHCSSAVFALWKRIEYNAKPSATASPAAAARAAEVTELKARRSTGRTATATAAAEGSQLFSITCFGIKADYINTPVTAVEHATTSKCLLTQWNSSCGAHSSLALRQNWERRHFSIMGRYKQARPIIIIDDSHKNKSSSERSPIINEGSSTGESSLGSSSRDSSCSSSEDIADFPSTVPKRSSISSDNNSNFPNGIDFTPKAVHRASPLFGPGRLTRQAVPLEAKLTQWTPPVQPQGKQSMKSIRVALLGAPNAGKSSLLNALLGKTIAAVSPKVNTTRGEIEGILTKENCQIIFTDAPGIIATHPKKKFCTDLQSVAWRGYETADLVLFIVDVVKRPTAELFSVVRFLSPRPSSFQRALCFNNTAAAAEAESEKSSQESMRALRAAGLPGSLIKQQANSTNDNSASNEYSATRIPVVLCLNKTDLASHPKWIYARAKEFQEHGKFESIFYFSAKTKSGLEPLIDFLFSQCRPGLWVYPQNMVTSLPKVEQVAEMIKTYLFCWFNKDVPYRLRQRTIGWTPQQDGSLIIEQEILVKNEKVAKMVCGVRSRILFQLRKNVTYKLEQNWGIKVFLYIHVKTLKQLT